MNKRVRTLLRVSSRQQLHDDDIPIQRAEAEQFIAKHPEWKFDKEYLEKGISAYHNGVDDREILQEILADAKAGEFEILLAYMSDRIGRQEEYSFYVAELNRLGIEVWTIKDGQLKTEEHIDKLLNYIRFWQNEGESKKTGMRFHDTMVEMVKSGKFVGGKAPFGYKMVLSGEISNHGRALHKLVIVPEQADVVRQIYSYAVNQGMGYQKISNTLNETGISAPVSETWKAGTVRSILTNPIYMGYIAYDRRGGGHGTTTKLDRKDWIYAKEQNKELIIVQQEVWERAQEIREARKNRIDASKQATNALYMQQYNVPFSTRGKLALTGLVYCGYCGKRLKNAGYANHWTNKTTGEKKVSYVGRYGCPNQCKPRHCYSQEYLESIVFDTLESYLENLKKIDVSKELEEMQAQQGKSILKEIKDTEKEIKNLVSDIETLEEKIPEAIRGEFAFSADKLSSIIKQKEALKNEKEGHKRSLQSRMNAIAVQNSELQAFIGVMPKWDVLFKEADIQTKQMLLSTLVDKIIVTDEEITIRFKIQLEKYMDKGLLESIGSGTTPYIPCSE